MDHATHNKIVSFIWSIADDCLRDVFVRGKYRDVIKQTEITTKKDSSNEDKSKYKVLKEGDSAYETRVLNNPDEQNRKIALESLIKDAVNKEQRRELELYKLYAGDSDFKKALNESLIRYLALEEKKSA